MRSRGLLLFTAFSAASLALLIGLGVWQLQRLEWKQGLIAQIEARANAEPVTLKEALTRARAGEDVSYLRVRVEGRFDNGKERYLYAVSDGTPGWHVITPLTTAGWRGRAGRPRLRPERVQGAVIAGARRDRR